MDHRRITNALRGICIAIVIACAPAGCGGGSGSWSGGGVVPLTVDVSTSEDVVVETGAGAITLAASSSRAIDSYVWRQVGGPRVPLTSGGAGATVDLAGFDVAVDTLLTFEVVATSGAEAVTVSASVVVRADSVEPGLGAIDPRAQIGGSSIATTSLEVGGETWALFGVGNRFSVTPITATSAVRAVHVEGVIRDIDIVAFGGSTFALLAMGTEGIAAVNVTDIASMTVYRDAIRVGYFKDGLSFTEGGGDILENETVTSVTAPVTALETDGTTLWIADGGFGLHRTALSNLLDPAGPALKADGTLAIDAEAFTLQYAGENPWGGPKSLRRFGGRLFAAQGYLGIGIYDEVTLATVGRYNLYTDHSVTEDWFIDMRPVDVVHSDTVTAQPFLDAVTGMPDYRQASFEIITVWHDKVVAPTPWADFDRYGKFYYDARAVDVATFGQRTIAYIAYGLAGLVAVDVTGFDLATPSSPITGAYLGYAPAPPAHGPDKPTGEQTKALFSYHGAGKLKEAGYNDVRVVGDRVVGVDHFGGVLVMKQADAPETAWRGPNGPYDNDDRTLADGVLGDHWPDTECVTSYDMSPHDPLDHESLPAWMYDPAGPSLLVTGEVKGHGRALSLLPRADLDALGGQQGADLFQCAASGGFVILDLDLSAAPGGDFAQRFAIVSAFATTGEIGAAPDGSPTQDISIGHADGLSASRRYLYVADGPHGVSAWRITDLDGTPNDDPRLVANTIQDEYPITLPSGEVIYPATHAVGALFDPMTESVLASCGSIGTRRIDVSGVEAGLGTPGAPLLIAPLPEDVFEHSIDEGDVGAIKKQDRAYDVALRGPLAFVADGDNGLTVFDMTRDPSNPLSGFIVTNVGGSTGAKPPLGRATGVALYKDPSDGREYAFVAAGPRGVGVVAIDVLNDHDVTLSLVKVFEPIKIEDGTANGADGRAVDVAVVRDHVFFTYDSFGIVCYAASDLTAPPPAGVDPTEIWKRGGSGTQFDYRPAAIGHFILDEVPGYEGVDGGALGMAVNDVGGRVTIVAGYGVGGLAVIDWTTPAAPALLHLVTTIGECNAVAIMNGRIYATDHDGGFTFWK